MDGSGFGVGGAGTELHSIDANYSLPLPAGQRAGS